MSLNQKTLFGTETATRLTGKFKPLCWHLPRPDSKYKGSYPLNFEKMFKEFIGTGEYLHLFSGSAKTGLRIDLKFENRPHIVADAHHLPFRDNVFKAILADPPYNAEYAKTLYGTPPRRLSST